MTNSYNSPTLPKIVFFHGLNNNPECFGPLMTHFQNLGHETEMVILPGHGENRSEAKDLPTAIKAFEASMLRLRELPYLAVAFSQGALYLQLWLAKHEDRRPLGQILLSPALYLRRQSLINLALQFVPSSLVIKSLAPLRFRRYEILTAGEYNTLVQGILAFQKGVTKFKIPTIVLIDPKDELVHAQELKKHHQEVEYFPRDYLKMGMGGHHILFHPDYFGKEDWEKFTRKMEVFLAKINYEA